MEQEVEHNSRPGPPLGSQNHRTHGLKTAKRQLKEFGSRAIDKRTSVGKALAEWQREVIEDLGGEDNLSAQKRAVLEVVVRLKLMLDSIDSWILQQPSMIDKRRRGLLPVIRERNSLSDSLVKHLSTLGLERQTKMIDVAAGFAELVRLESEKKANTPAPVEAVHE